LASRIVTEGTTNSENRDRFSRAQNVALPTNTACGAIDLQRIFRSAQAEAESEKLHPKDGTGPDGNAKKTW
jgi:hypothetical protein